MSRQLLITHFEPFGGRGFNASEVLATELQDQLMRSEVVAVAQSPKELQLQNDLSTPTRLRGAHFGDGEQALSIVVQKLPVSASGVRAFCTELWTQASTTLAPNMALLFGESSRQVQSGKLALERVALNVEHFPTFADNEGATACHRPILEGGPDALTTNCNIRSLQSVCAEFASVVEVSYFCGTYICNSLYYQVLAAKPQATRALFVHVPAFEAQEELQQRLPDYIKALDRLLSLLR